MADERAIRKLRKQLDAALAKQRIDSAIDLLERLMEVDPTVPRWPHKRGDLLRKQGRRREAIETYAVAVNLYADQGFIARAVAMAKTILNLDSTRIDVLQRVDPEAARRLHRAARPMSAPLKPPHPAILPDDAPAPAHPAVLLDDAPPPRHPAILPDDAPEPPPRHPMVLDEEPMVLDEAPAPPRHPMVIEEDEEPVAPPPLRNHPMVIPEEEPPRERSRRISLDEISRPVGAARPGRPPAPPPLPRAPKLPDLGNQYRTVLEQADELVIAPDAQPNETRFSNAPPARGIELEVSDLEFEQRQQSPGDESLRPDPPSVGNLSKLPLFPLFAEIPRESMAQLVTGSEVIELADGELVVKKGEPADALYGIVEGSVQVRLAGKRVGITLAEGDVFGESCLLPGERRPADIEVKGHLLALRVSRTTLNALIAKHPELAEVILELLTRRLLSSLLLSSPLFQELDAQGRQDMARTFEVRRAPKGTQLAVEGKIMDGLYISLTGELEVSASDGRPVERHGAGSLFGQASLLLRSPSEVTIRTLSPMIVLRLSTQAFHGIAMQHPAMLAHLSDLSTTPIARIIT